MHHMDCLRSCWGLVHHHNILQRVNKKTSLNTFLQVMYDLSSCTPVLQGAHIIDYTGYKHRSIRNVQLHHPQPSQWIQKEFLHLMTSHVHIPIWLCYVLQATNTHYVHKQVKASLGTIMCMMDKTTSGFLPWGWSPSLVIKLFNRVALLREYIVGWVWASHMKSYLHPSHITL